MVGSNLSEVVRELADQFAFLPRNQVVELIANIIEESLPLGILAMRDDLAVVEEVKMKKAELREQRTWGKELSELRKVQIRRREVLDHVIEAKKSLSPREIDHGSMTMLIRPLHSGYGSLLETVQVGTEYAEEHEPLLPKKDSAFEEVVLLPRGSNLQYSVDDSLIEKMGSEPLFASFCSIIEKTTRKFARIHKNRLVFNLAERKDIELPDWRRTVLHIEFPELKFDDSNNLWTLVSSETRKDLARALAQMSESQQVEFKNYISNFNVEMVI